MVERKIDRIPLRMRFAVTLIAALLLAGGTALPGNRNTSTTARAAACWDFGCYPQDPQALACNDSSAQTYQRILGDTYYPSWIDIRYSGNCGANWGRTASSWCYGPGDCPSGVLLEALLYGTSLRQTVAYPYYDYNTVHWSTMDSGASSSDRTCRWDQQYVCTNWW